MPETMLCPFFKTTDGKDIFIQWTPHTMDSYSPKNLFATKEKEASRKYKDDSKDGSDWERHEYVFYTCSLSGLSKCLDCYNHNKDNFQKMGLKLR